MARETRSGIKKRECISPPSLTSFCGCHSVIALI
jgi:hypothetical protein